MLGFATGAGLAPERAAAQQAGHRRDERERRDQRERHRRRDSASAARWCRRDAHAAPEVSKLPEGAGVAFGVGAGVRAGGTYRGVGRGQRRVAAGVGVAGAVGATWTGAGLGAATTLRCFGFGLGFGLGLGLRGSRSAGTRAAALSATFGAAPGRSTSGDGVAARTAAFGDDERPSVCMPKHTLNRSETTSDGRAEAQPAGHLTGLVFPGIRQRSRRSGALPRRVRTRVYLPIFCACVTRISIVAFGR